MQLSGKRSRLALPPGQIERDHQLSGGTLRRSCEAVSDGRQDFPSDSQPDNSGIISEELSEASKVEPRILEAVHEVHRRAREDFSPPPVHRLEAMMA
jgi:hypothetical protein